MRYLKTYESLNNKPKIGDYVKMRTDSHNTNLQHYFNNYFGRVTDVSDFSITVAFKYEPPKTTKQIFDYNWETDEYKKMFNINKVVEFADTEENLILHLKYGTKKYNL